MESQPKQGKHPEDPINPIVDIEASVDAGERQTAQEQPRQEKGKDEPIEMPRSLNSTMQYKSSMADEEEKDEVEELLLGAEKKERQEYPGGIVEEINRAIEAEEGTRKSENLIALEEYKALAERYHRAEYERGQMVKAL